MATITTAVYLEDAARSAGEAMTINSGGQLTIRSDTRTHANAPGPDTGSLGSVTITEGKLIWDSQSVRWMEYNNGSGNVPAVGTLVYQGETYGYLLGVWASKTAAKTAAGSAMPTTGFLKFREVGSGNFTAGPLTNIGADAVSQEVQGWISITHDAGANFTVPRLGEHRARGGRFFLEKTTGVLGQVFQVPTEGSTAMFAPGLWVETAENSDVFEYWPSLCGASNGWAQQHIGEAKGASDKRQKFVKGVAGGQLIMGEDFTTSTTYVTQAAQASTYAEISHSCTYIRESEKIIVYYASGHLLETGQQTGLDFTSGSATGNDGIYEVTVLSPYHFSVSVGGGGIGGNVTSKPGLTISYSAHGLNIGERVYCDFTSGTAVDNTFEIYAVTSVNAYLIKYPHVASITSGNTSVLHSLNITSTAHGLAIGNKVKLEFTSGNGVSGIYTVKFLTSADGYRINCPISAVTSGNVTMTRQIGYVAPSNCRTWIGSNILNECATANRTINTIPNATIASRPEWATSNAGAIDLEYVYGCSGYPLFAQPYSVRMLNCSFFDTLNISECATALDIDCNISMAGALDVVTLSLVSNFAGGSVKGKFLRGNLPATNDHAAVIQYCKNVNLNNVEAGIIQYVRSTGIAFSMAYCDNITMNDCRSFNGNIALTACTNFTINDLDHCDRFNGRTNSTTPLYAVLLAAGCVNIKTDGVTFGFVNTIEDCHPYSGVLNVTASKDIKLRNIGSRNSLTSSGIWAKNTYIMGYIYSSGGNNSNIKIQKCYFDGIRVTPFNTVNSDKNVLYESCFAGNYAWPTKAILSLTHNDLNCHVKGCQEIIATSGQTSVYGTHFLDNFLGEYGRFVLLMNEPTTETSTIFSMDVGTAKFNSAGALYLLNIGEQATFTDNIYRKGHTAFDKTEVLLSGPTQTRFEMFYAIDLGSGFGSFHNLYIRKVGASGTSGQFTFTLSNVTGLEVGDYIFGTGRANIGKITEINGNIITSDVANSGTVSGTLTFNHIPLEVVNPSTGFKLKLRIKCITTETAPCYALRINTMSDLSSQANNLYPLDVNTLTMTGILAGSDVIVYRSGTTTILQNSQEISGTTNTFQYETPESIDIGVFKAGYIPFFIRNYSLSGVDASVPVAQSVDRAYIE